MNSFVRNRKAVAALEFGLAAPFLALVLASAADFGFAHWRRSALTNAVSLGGYSAFRTGPTMIAATVKAMVQNGAPFPGVTATVGTPACYCLSYAATPATLTATTCGRTCADNTAAVKYVTISANYTLTSFLPGTSAYNHLDKVVSGTVTHDTVSDSVTVRLQ